MQEVQFPEHLAFLLTESARYNKLSGIYGIINKFTGKLYVGSAVKFHRRYTDHIYFLKLNQHHSILLQRAWDKYGEDAFEFIVLEFVSDIHKLLEHEQYWIDLTKCFDTSLGYNISPTAGSLLGLRQSDAAKLKKSIALKGIVRSEETKVKMSKAKKGHIVSEEARLKIGLAGIGRVVSAETKLKLSATSLGRVHSAETKIKMKIAASKREISQNFIASRGNNKDRKQTAEEIAKRIESRKRNKLINSVVL